MYNNKTLLLSFFWIALGLGLIALHTHGQLPQSVAMGLGCGFAGIGVGQLVRYYHYHNSPAYKEKVDISVSDERNQYLMNSAWAMAARIYAVLAALAVLAASFVPAWQAAVPYLSGSLGVLMALYLLSWLWYRRHR